MNSSLIWPLLAIAGGSFLLFCGVSTLFYWRKRARWQRCVGVIQDVKSQNDSDGILMYYPIIKGVHRSEEFQFTGEGSAREIEVGTNIAVSYDPVTGRYFDYHPISFLLAIIAPIVIGVALYVVALRLYQNN